MSQVQPLPSISKALAVPIPGPRSIRRLYVQVALAVVVCALVGLLLFPYLAPQYTLTGTLMLLVALTASALALQIGQEAHSSQERERVTAILFKLSDIFANSTGTETLIHTAVHYVTDIFKLKALILLPDALNHLRAAFPEQGTVALQPHEEGVAQWVYEHAQSAGATTDILPSASGLYLPLTTSRGTVGVLAVYPTQPLLSLSSEERHMLLVVTNQTALAIERSRLAEEAEQTKLEMEAERMRNTLLSSVSHDLRTPLASIMGSVSSLLDGEARLSTDGRHELAQVAYEEAKRLNRLLGNLLDMTRIEAGGIRVNKQWQALEEVVGVVLNRFEVQSKDHPIDIALPPDLPFVPIDETLIVQVLVNLIENAVKYTPALTPIQLSAKARSADIVVTVADRGPGLLPGDEERVFTKFYRGQPATTGGVGLGLAICRGIVEAHGGRIWAQNRPDGGASFSFTLPLDGGAPQVDLDE